MKNGSGSRFTPGWCNRNTCRGSGVTGSSRPYSRATCGAHGPAAFTSRPASTVNSSAFFADAVPSVSARLIPRGDTRRSVTRYGDDAPSTPTTCHRSSNCTPPACAWSR
jgi:hypothetical protein